MRVGKTGEEIEPMIKKILVPLDGSNLAESVLPHVIAMSTPFEAQITLLGVVERPESPDERPIDSVHWRLVRAETAAYLRKIGNWFQEKGYRAELIVYEGSPAEKICECRREEKADLIVMSSHGHGGQSGFAFGNTLQQVVSSAGISVMIVRPHEQRSMDLNGLGYRRVMVPLDGSRRAEWALCLAAAIAAKHRAELLMAHVVAVPDMVRQTPLNSEEAKLSEQIVEVNRAAAVAYLEQLKGKLSTPEIATRIHLVVASGVARTLQDIVAAEDVDLLVLSAHGYSGKEQWLYGGVAGSLIAHMTTPLLVFQDVDYKDVGCEKGGPLRSELYAEQVQ